MKDVKGLLLLDHPSVIVRESGAPSTFGFVTMLDGLMEYGKLYQFIFSPSLEEVKILGEFDPSDKITPMMYTEKQFIQMKAVDEVWIGGNFVTETTLGFVTSIIKLAKKNLGESNVKPIGVIAENFLKSLK